jgi:hypothetical protein
MLTGKDKITNAFLDGNNLFLFMNFDSLYYYSLFNGYLLDKMLNYGKEVVHYIHKVRYKK